jgi:hypothetical protein
MVGYSSEVGKAPPLASTLSANVVSDVACTHTQSSEYVRSHQRSSYVNNHRLCLGTGAEVEYASWASHEESIS